VKLALLADIHLGFRQYHRHTAAGINQREADVANAFRGAVDGVLTARPDLIILAGDFFHSVRPTNQAIVFAFQQLQRLVHGCPDAPVILLAGNHDTPRSVETGSILTLFREVGVEVVDVAPRRLVYPDLDLAVLAVPHPALVGPERPELRPHSDARYQVLTMHAEIEGTFPSDRDAVEYGGALVRPSDYDPAEWTFVALGHYHVQHRVAPNAWYAGALEYVSTNPWGELRDEDERGFTGKGWLLVDLDSGEVARRPVPAARRLMDLPPIEGADLSAAELDRLIGDRVHALSDGIDDQIVRLVIYDVPRHISREMDHAAIRAFKSQALHFHLDMRRPRSHRTIGVGGPGRRQTLPEIVEEYLGRRPLPEEVDRAAFVGLGTELLAQVAREEVVE